MTAKTLTLKNIFMNHIYSSAEKYILYDLFCRFLPTTTNMNSSNILELIHQFMDKLFSTKYEIKSIKNQYYNWARNVNDIFPGIYDTFKSFLAFNDVSLHNNETSDAERSIHQAQF